MADALMELVTGTARGTGTGPEVHVTVEATALLRGYSKPGETCSIEGIGQVPVATARKLLGDGYLSILVTRGTDVMTVAHAGRAVPADVDTALKARDRTCCVPGCEVSEALERDHRVIPFIDGGTTALSNLARLCRWHHYLRTYKGWRLEGESGSWQWVGPELGSEERHRRSHGMGRPGRTARQSRSIGLIRAYRCSDGSGYVGPMRAPFSWTDSVVVITGGSRGIGLAIAIEALARGRVGLISRSATDLERAASRLLDTHAAGGASAVSNRVITAVADVAVRSELEAALEEITLGLGPVDVLVNNAGTGAYGEFVEGNLDALESALRVNFLGTVYGTRAVLPGMLDRRRGHVVNISSVAGRVATPGESAYSASKFAVVGFTQCVAIELRDSAVGISMVLPGPVDTSRHFGNDGRAGGSFPPTVPAERVARATLDAVDKRQTRSGRTALVQDHRDDPGGILGCDREASGPPLRSRGRGRVAG